MSEDLNPVVPAEEQPVEIKEEAIVEEAAAQTSDQPNAESVPETAPENTRTDFSNMGLKEIVDTFKELIDGENMQQLYKHAEALKVNARVWYVLNQSSCFFITWMFFYIAICMRALIVRMERLKINFVITVDLNRKPFCSMTNNLITFTIDSDST